MEVFLSSRQRWRLLIVLTIVWGCFLRFYAIGERIYWEDETFTSLRLSGYSQQELVETAFQGDIVYSKDLLQFQTAAVDRSLGDTIHSLVDDTHPPGYFVLLRLWASWFGRSVTSLRALSATVSLLLLPGVFGIAWMLFESSPQRWAIAELSTALVAVSPYQIALANEARMYSLLPVATTLAGLCLLWAVRSSSARSARSSAWSSGRWGWYGLASTASVYVHWLAVPMLAGYGLYVSVQKHVQKQVSRHWVRSQRQYLLTTALTVGAVAPWVLFMGRQMNNVYYQTKWAGEAVSFWGDEESLGQLWLQHGLMLFVNGEAFDMPRAVWIGGCLAIAFILSALFYLVRHTELSVWSFLLISSGIIYLPLAVSDVIMGGRRSGIFRYLSPSLSAIEIAVAFCLVSLGGITLVKAQANAPLNTPFETPAERHAERQWQGKVPQIFRRMARWTIVLLLIGGALSQTVVKVTYSVEQHPLGHIARIVNQTPNALLLSDAPRPSLLLPLAHLLKAETPLKLTVRPDWPALEETGDRPIFLYLASEEFQASLIAQGNRLHPVTGVDNLLSMERSHPDSPQAAR